MQRRAAVTAMVAGERVGAQPVPARFAIRVDALYGPAGHILHGSSLELPLEMVRASPPRVTKKRNSAPCALAVSRKNTLYIVCSLQIRLNGRVVPLRHASFRLAPHLTLRHTPPPALVQRGYIIGNVTLFQVHAEAPRRSR